MSEENLIEQERKRIHADAHDKVYNRLSALAKRIEALSFEASIEKDVLDGVSVSIREAVGDLQDIVSNKQEVDGLIPTSSTGKEIRHLCQEHVLNYQQQIAFTCQTGHYELLDQKDLWHLQCILQECLNNAGKHSKARGINISLMEKNNQLVMQVADNGLGFGCSTYSNGQFSSGQGLKGMKQRVSILRGKLNIESSKKGTIITVKIPLRKQKPQNPNH